MIGAGFKINEVKGLFFDRGAVIAATTRAERKVLSRFGAFVRTAARSKIRKRKRSSSPGFPPSSHVGTLRRWILFAYEPPRNVVIGPVLSARKTRDGAPLAPSLTTPEVLEYGGSVGIEEYQREYTPKGRIIVEKKWGRDPDAWHRLGKKRLWHKKGQPLRIRARRKRTIAVAARPFMRPAFEQEKGKLPALWANSIK